MAKTEKKRTPDEIRREITKMMAEAIEKDQIPWRTPWSKSPNTGAPCNFQSKRRYNGINALLLMWSGIGRDMPSKNWGTSNSWTKQTGGYVRRGESATRITLFNLIPKRDPETKQVELDKDGNEKKIPIMREFPVFNIDQIDPPQVDLMLKWKRATLEANAKKYGVKFTEKTTDRKIAQGIRDTVKEKLDSYRVFLTKQNDDPDFAPAEALIEACGAKLVVGQTASYSPGSDEVTLPPKETFESMGAYYETTFHELVHWTGHKSRLDREEKLGKRKEDYAFEELVAEIGACYLCMELNVPHAEEMLAKSKAYVKGWVSKLKNDPKYIFDAAKLASAAADMLLGHVGLSDEEVSIPYVEEEKPVRKKTAKKKTTKKTVKKKASKKKAPAKKATKKRQAA